jgi:hypothetical protein
LARSALPIGAFPFAAPLGLAPFFAHADALDRGAGDEQVIENRDVDELERLAYRIG